MRNIRLKIALLGDAGVGKTSLRRSFMGQSFATQHLMTIGADFSTAQFELEGDSITYQIWDIAGDQSLSRIRTQFYNGIKGALCVFDINRQDSYLNIPTWINEMWQHNGQGEIPLVLLGNKSDLRSEGSVSLESAEEYARQIQDSMKKRYKITYLDTSAKNGFNVQEAFEALAHQILLTID
ncbi:MAG: GTP-binding protein [Candidatus Kariarchaeaceae archaeon]|jgi:small GTP-binding protein